jgi:hypothetical protein
MLSQAQVENPFVIFLAFCKISSVFVVFVIFPYCANRIGQQALARLHPDERTSLKRS